MLIAPKRLKTPTSNSLGTFQGSMPAKFEDFKLAGMLPWNVPREFLKKIFSKGGVAIVT